MLRLTLRKYVLSPLTVTANFLESSPSGGSTLITSAPRSPSSMVQNGPAMTLDRSRTLTPSSGSTQIRHIAV